MTRRAAPRPRATARLETIERACDPHRLYGVVVAESDRLLLLHQEVDFLFDGCVVVRREDVTARARSAPSGCDLTRSLLRGSGGRLRAHRADS